MISVIVPAHNEEAVIARGLRAIVTGAAPGELEVIVACNGCTDRTAEIAASFGPPLRVLNVPVASKIGALNAADEVASGFPRFYVDADVVLDLASIRKMAGVLERGDVHFATPTLQMDVDGTGWLTRAFYRVWTSLPYNSERGAVGTGVFALSKGGRSRFGTFPQVIADDGFVRALFSPSERATVSGATVVVTAPRSFHGLLKIQTRGRLGCLDLQSRYPDLPVLDHKDSAGLFFFMACRPALWPHIPCYLLINAWTRRRAHAQLRAGLRAWERDESSRSTQASPVRAAESGPMS